MLEGRNYKEGTSEETWLDGVKGYEKLQPLWSRCTGIK